MIKIKCHASWLKNIQFIENKLYQILLNKNSNKLAKINTAGYAEVSFTKNLINNKLKEKILNLNLSGFMLMRKWDNIDSNFISKYDIAEEIKHEVVEKFKTGLSITQIAKEFNYSYGGIRRIIKNKPL